MRRRAGFTWIEILAVIGIIAALVALLFPVFARAREKAHQASCQSNLLSLYKAFTLYQYDSDATALLSGPGPDFEKFISVSLPLPSDWGGDVLTCPSDNRDHQITDGWDIGYPTFLYRACSYGWNTYGLSGSGGRGVEQLVDPKRVPLVGDAEALRLTDPKTIVSSLALRHNHGVNLAFCDGHVRWIAEDQVKRCEWRDYTCYPNELHAVQWRGEYAGPMPSLLRDPAALNSSERLTRDYLFKGPLGRVYHLRVRGGRIEETQ